MRPLRTMRGGWVGLGILAGALPGCTSGGPASAYVMTVSGPIARDRMGVTLPHEHVLVDFAGADVASPDRYERPEVVAMVLPYLEEARALGMQTLIEATPAYLGRDPLLLRQLADATGLHLLVSTGYYGARDDQHLPRHAFDASADSLAARWIHEWEVGIDGTAIRPGFIKIGVNPGPLSGVHRTLVQAAARTHLRTGLTIASHTGPAPAALEQLQVLESEGVDPSAWVWVHAQAEPDATQHVAAARRGAWISFDGLGPDQVEEYVERVVFMKAQGLLHRVLLSHDAGWYHVGEPAGGAFRPYDTLFSELIPALAAAGVTDDEMHQVTVVNPGEAFAVRVRSRQP